MAATKDKPFTYRLTDDMIRKACDMSNIEHYPFIHILPMTHPSKQLCKLDMLFYKQKLSLIQFQKTMKKSRRRKTNTSKKLSTPRKKFDYLKFIREQQEKQASKLCIRNPDLCHIEKCRIAGIECEWLKYRGSSIDNGVIIIVHGGAYVMGSTQHKHQQSEVMSKLTGCICLLVNYSLAPEDPLPKCVDEIISVYRYLINDLQIPSYKISLEGESAGGGAILLTLQKMKHTLNMDLPSCVWVNSPWTDLSDSLPSKQRNADCDAMLAFDKRKSTNNLAVGNRDYFGKNTGNNYKLECETFSPLFGNWNALCPIYFMCGATECLLDDTIYAAKKAYECGVSVKVDIDPYMMHAGCVFARVPESYASIIRGCAWIMKHRNHRKAKL